MKQYFVYIMTNERNTVLYTGMTNDLNRRVREHKEKVIGGFTKKYNVVKLVYYEVFRTVEGAIQREKQIKNWKRRWKVELIEKVNPKWKEVGDFAGLGDSVSSTE